MDNYGNKDIMSRNIKHYMQLRNKTRNEISKDLGVSYSTFSDWENGNTYPRIDKIEMLANYFGIQKSDLIEEKSNYISIPESFRSAEEAMRFILDQKVMMAYGGYDLDEMSDDEILDIAESMLMTLRISLERRKKKKGE